VFHTSCDKKELQKLKSCIVAHCATADPGSAMLSRIKRFTWAKKMATIKNIVLDNKNRYLC
jgi:hypothetical protein